MLPQFLSRAALAAVVLATASTGAFAAPVFTAFGDPFPVGSTVTMVPGSPGNFGTPFGTVEEIVLSNFSLLSTSPAGSDIKYIYSATFFNEFLSGPGGSVVGSFTGTTSNFDVTLFGRTGAFNTGPFNAEITAATFAGDVKDASNAVVFSNFMTGISPTIDSTGTATFTGPVVVDGNLGLMANTSFNVQGQYSTDGGNSFTPTPPLNADSTPAAAPAPATAALMLLGLAGIARARRQRAAA